MGRMAHGCREGLPGTGRDPGEAIDLGTRVVLAHDHHMARQGMRVLLDGLSGVTVVGEADDGYEAVRLARELAPDVAIVSVALPQLNGIEATRRICSETPDVKVIGVCAHADRRFAAEMFGAGAAAFLSKDAPFEELVSAIGALRDDHKYVGESLAHAIVDEFVNHSAMGDHLPDEPGVAPELSPREREVLQLLAEGSSAKQIASRLTLSVKTVETHRRHIMERLRIDSVAGLVRYALREGLTTLDIDD